MHTVTVISFDMSNHMVDNEPFAWKSELSGGELLASLQAEYGTLKKYIHTIDKKGQEQFAGWVFEKQERGIGIYHKEYTQETWVLLMNHDEMRS